MIAVGLDIGGANIKAADVDGRTLTRSFEIWKSPHRLSEEITRILAEWDQVDLLALTMTAELSDCFTTKGEGVDFILSAVESAAPNVPIAVWQTGAEFVAPAVAREIPLLVAAANWHALATWIGRVVPNSTALLIDIGTTTTDIIPLSNGLPVPIGLTDVERLQSGELVYSGVRRTPICALAQSVPLRGEACPIAAELFATTLDLYLLLGLITEDENDHATANGRAATREAAHDRMARMLCCDRTELTPAEINLIAGYLAEAQQQQISTALRHVLDRQPDKPAQVLISGSGSFLAREIIAKLPQLATVKIISLNEMFDAQTSIACCAFAVARLAAEHSPL